MSPFTRTQPARAWSLARLLVLLVAAMSAWSTARGDDAPADAPVDAAWFGAHVQPIFAAKCQRCHGPDVQKSALDLSTPGGIRQGGESGSILDADAPQDGTLYEYVHERMMPPEDEGELTDDEIATIVRWIDAGAQLGDAPAAEELELSQHDVLPTLLLRCAICHGRQRQRRRTRHPQRRLACLKGASPDRPSCLASPTKA